MTVAKDILYIGVNDHTLDLFEGQYPVPKGMAYNSYVILDERVAVLDTVDQHFQDQWLTNLETALAGRKPDYLIVQHMEPDHSAAVAAFVSRYPEATIAASAKAFPMLEHYYGDICGENRLVLGDRETLDLGTHQLCFLTAPMVIGRRSWSPMTPMPRRCFPQTPSESLARWIRRSHGQRRPDATILALWENTGRRS